MTGDDARADDAASAATDAADSLFGPADPLADLMFTMVAITIIACLVVLPQIRPVRSPAADSAPRPQILQTSYTIDGRPAAPLIAGADGVVLPPGDGGAIALDDIVGSSDLERFLEGLKARDQRVLEAVDADGSEAALQLETMLARHAPQPVFEMRAVDGCFAFADAAPMRRPCAQTARPPP